MSHKCNRKCYVLINSKLRVMLLMSGITQTDINVSVNVAGLLKNRTVEND